ncbi:actin-like ATPase domain-containing protein [Cadophora sp. DSE1049]|nr:actin-like ATPase domain-containing protein [Cadophora sp. DSE1049]
MAVDWGQDFIDSTPIEYILTVPAVWSDKAKSDTLWCASQAGFGAMDKIRLITEPEAAAVYTFTTLPEYSVKKGEIFITCDAGGGTVDLTTYKVAADAPMLRLDEITEGDGGLCGSVYLNRRFEELVRKKIGNQLDALPKTVSLEAVGQIQRHFNEEIKPDFGISDDSEKTYAIEIPSSIKDDNSEGIKDGCLTITSEELKEVFDAVIRMIFQLIIGQMERLEEAGGLTAFAILLVGGFGSSEYLRKQIEEHFGDDVKVIQPVNAWSAVTRGAMLRALQGDIVETRIIRSNYGIMVREPWDPAIHEIPERERVAAKNKVFEENEQEWKCTNVMRWYTKKGDEFSKRKVVSFPFFQTKSDLNDLVFTVGLLAYNEPGEVPYFWNTNCKTIVTLKADLSTVPKSSFEVVSGSKGDYYKIWYTIEMSFEAAISFRLIYQREVLGELTVDYGRR